MKELAILVGVPVAIWGVLLVPGWYFWGEDALRHSGVALALSLVPAIATFLAIRRFTATADDRLLATLGSSGVRMAVSLGIGWLLYANFEGLFPAAFMYWLAVFYLVVLALEVTLLVRQPPAKAVTVSSSGKPSP